MKSTANKLFLLSLIIFFTNCLSNKTEQKSKTSKSTSIGIISAMPQELESLLKMMINSVPIKIGSDTFYKGTIGSKTIIASISGIGKVNAASISQKLISHFNPFIILFTGVAGGINPTFEIGDIVIVEKAFQHDFGYLGQKGLLNHKSGTMPEFGFGSFSDSIFFLLENNFPNDLSFESIYKTILNTSFDFQHLRVNNTDYYPQIRKGVVASGDQFIALEQKKLELKKLGADIVEMEGAAVAQVAQNNSIPCIIIRSISDKAGSNAHIDFKSFSDKTSINNTIVVEKILNIL